MTASTAASAIGRGKPPLHSRFQQALLAALEKSPAALELSQPENGIAALARRMVLDAAAGRGAALRLVLSQLDAECEREDQLAPERNMADPFCLIQGEFQGGREDSTEAARQVEGYPSPAKAQVSSAVPASLSLKGRGEGLGVASAASRTVPERNMADLFSLVQGESQGSEENPAEKICVAAAANRAPAAAPAHTTLRAQLMMGTAVMTSAPVSPARLNRQSALGHPLVERAACSSGIESG